MESPVNAAFGKVKRAARQVCGFSIVANLLLLVAPIYMLQIYDRVLTSGSTETLVVLTVIALFLLALLGILEVVRNRIMVRTGTAIDHALQDVVYSKTVVASSEASGDGVQLVRDLDTLRQFISSNAPLAFFDAPWTPFFILVVALMHPLLGAIALVGALIILVLALATERISRADFKKAAGLSMQANQFLEASMRNSEVIRAMNVSDGLRKRWTEQRLEGVGLQAEASEKLGFLLGITKAVRFTLQVVMLGCGGWLAIEQVISPGVIVAASIIMGRALAPVEQAIGSWRHVVASKTAYERLRKVLEDVPVSGEEPVKLPRPDGSLTVEGLTAVLPGSTDPVLKSVSFSAEQGDIIGVIGPSGAGKTFLARHLIGVRKSFRGNVRLGGIDVAGWQDSDRGTHIGYLPQDIELFSGTIAENIARFAEIDADKIVEAATLADCHQLILNMPNGYETRIGTGGIFLSGGQSQRIALARAIYNDPVFVVLDEPNSNLDTEGELALQNCLKALRDRGITTVIITHNLRLLQTVDRVLMLKDGSVGSYGSRDEVLQKFMRPVKAVSSGEAQHGAG